MMYWEEGRANVNVQFGQGGWEDDPTDSTIQTVKIN
jgi:hypothetical protein